MGFFPGKATVARPHHLLHGDEKDATGGCDTDAGFLSCFTNVAELEGHLEGQRVDGDPVLVGHKDSRLFFDLRLNHRHDLFFAKTTGEGQGGDQEGKKHSACSHGSGSMLTNENLTDERFHSPTSEV